MHTCTTKKTEVSDRALNPEYSEIRSIISHTQKPHWLTLLSQSDCLNYMPGIGMIPSLK